MFSQHVSLDFCGLCTLLGGNDCQVISQDMVLHLEDVMEQLRNSFPSPKGKSFSRA